MRSAAIDFDIVYSNNYEIALRLTTRQFMSM